MYQAASDGHLSTQEAQADGQNTQNGQITPDSGNVQITPVDQTSASSGQKTSETSSDNNNQKVTGKNGGPGVKGDSSGNANNGGVITGQAPG